VRKLRRRHFTRRTVALPVRIRISRAPASRVPGLPLAAPHGALLLLRADPNASTTMRLTNRCRSIFLLLKGARWLTTGQLKRCFFRHASADACRKRLRCLTAHGYLIRRQEHRMAQALFTLGSKGKRVVEEHRAANTSPERRVPKQLEHLLGINDLRIAAVLTDGLGYFYASWELSRLGWRHPIIPDALFSLGGRTWAAEFDRGLEGLGFFLRTKLPAYERGLPGLKLAGVLVIAECPARMESLAHAIGGRPASFVFATLDAVRRNDLRAPVFYRPHERKPVTLV